MNCKPGDLAIIRGMRNYPEDNGKIVEVLNRCTHGEKYLSVSGRRYELMADDAPFAWRVRGREPLRMQTVRGDEYFYEVPVLSSRLIPISGVPVADEVKDEVTP